MLAGETVDFATPICPNLPRPGIEGGQEMEASRR